MLNSNIPIPHIPQRSQFGLLKKYRDVIVSAVKLLDYEYKEF